MSFVLRLSSRALRLPTAIPLQGLSKPLLVRFASDEAKLPRDEEIRLRHVHLSTGGKLGDLVSLKDLLERVKSKVLDEETGKMVNPGKSLELVSTDPPIVRIIDHKAEYRREKEKKKEKLATRAKSQPKEHQMTWGVASGDLDHKIKKIRKDLEKGHPIHFVLAPKKDTPLPPREERDAKVQDIIGRIADIACESKPQDFQRGTLIMYLEKK